MKSIIKILVLSILLFGAIDSIAHSSEKSRTVLNNNKNNSASDYNKLVVQNTNENNKSCIKIDNREEHKKLEIFDENNELLDDYYDNFYCIEAATADKYNILENDIFYDIDDIKNNKYEAFYNIEK